MKLKSMIGALSAVLILAGGAHAQAPQETRPTKTASAAAAAPPAAPATTPALTKADLDSWLDGYLPYALASADIAGAVVVVVKDGQVLTEKGYGYADVKSKRPIDPKATLFRPGSVSKLFTWTAVMQQVEAGKIDLDGDVNQYLDFKIPAYGGKPVTMRDLMTHTAGFAETIKHLFPGDTKVLLPLDKFISVWTPNRIFPPGEVPAYSNYGAALAGYIVQRTSGEPFDQYVAKHIFAPLEMNHSSFSQPLQPNLLAGMASGYLRASGPPQNYELVGPAPAGSLATTGDDVSRFMIAHLNNGQYGSVRILQDATARQMHAPQKQYVPPLNGMALGFYHEDRNGHVIVGHGGDTVAFHSDLHLLLNDGVGFFISMNSAGKGGLVQNVRETLLSSFMDRYYPAPEAPLPTAATAKAHAAMMQGVYWSSRRVDTGFLRVLNLLGQMKVAANKDGTLVVSNLKDDAGTPFVWREVGPFVWKDASGKHTLAAVVKDGKVTGFGEDDLAAIMVFQPVPFAASSAWNVPLLIGMCGVLLAMLALWPVQALVRRRYGQSFPLSGRTAMLYRAVRVAGLLDLLALAGYVGIAQAASTKIYLFDDALDIWLRLLQLVCLLGVIGAGLSVWNAVRVWTEAGRSWWAKTSVTGIMLALLAFVWFVVSLQLVSPGLNY
ncbi:serine hydrolase domain-containing protein [Phenylobacterium sp.]|uniref:serine hydrolase domain-containing protein n=1 Tax=Phenylobacterium sp. TaxID=1871053 RepID=UPI003568F015